MCAGQRIQGQEQNAQAQRTKILAGRRRRNRRRDPACSRDCHSTRPANDQCHRDRRRGDSGCRQNP